MKEKPDELKMIFDAVNHLKKTGKRCTDPCVLVTLDRENQNKIRETKLCWNSRRLRVHEAIKAIASTSEKKVLLHFWRERGTSYLAVS